MTWPPDRLDFALMTLVALALATMALAGVDWNPVIVDGLVLAIAAAKGRRILLDYLGLRSAPALWRGLATAWLVLLVSFACAVSAVSFLRS